MFLRHQLSHFQVKKNLIGADFHRDIAEGKFYSMPGVLLDKKKTLSCEKYTCNRSVELIFKNKNRKLKSLRVENTEEICASFHALNILDAKKREFLNDSFLFTDYNQRSKKKQDSGGSFRKKFSPLECF